MFEMATPKTTHRCFTVVLKLKAVVTAERTSKSEAAKLFNIDPKHIREWWAPQKRSVAKDEVQPIHKKRLDGGNLTAIIFKE